MRTARGLTAERPCSVAAEGVSARRESRLRRDEQAPSGRAPAGQNRSRHAVTWEKPPAGQKKTPRSGIRTQGHTQPPAAPADLDPPPKHLGESAGRGQRGTGVAVRSARRVPAAIPPEAAGTERACRGGVSLARFHANSEGPRRGTSLLGRSRRSLGAQRVPPAAGRASAEGPRTCRAKQKPSRSDMGETTRGAKENSTEWKNRAAPRSRGTTSPATQWSGKAALELRLELPYFTPSSSTSKISVALGGISPG